jgi:4-hydroxy-3-methylbut-2-enyl diphosphate reductase
LKVTIDPHSGFCFGVKYAIEVAERELLLDHTLFCLGDIVHNNMEVNRLKEMGLVIITHDELNNLSDCKVLFRAHGEPPETYKIAIQNNLELIDATCPIVLNLQNEIYRGYLEMQAVQGQIAIYGKEGHAEVNALKGQTNGTAIVVGNENDLTNIDFKRPVRLYSQTTMGVDDFHEIDRLIRERMEQNATAHPIDFEWNDTICRQVSNRSDQVREFAGKFDLVIFVSGQKSSNGMILYQVCQSANPRTELVSGPDEMKHEWFENIQTVGICGATSTPGWLMEEIAQRIQIIHS